MTCQTVPELLAGEPTHLALFADNGRRSLLRGELASQVERFAGRFAAAGLKPGDPIGIVLPNGIEFLIVFLAAVRARLIAAPLNPAYTSEEFQFYLADAGAKAIIVSVSDTAATVAAERLALPRWFVAVRGTDVHIDGLPDTVIEAPPPNSTDVALFLHTSGTTGRPKGVPLTHGNLAWAAAAVARHYALTPVDRSLVVMPLFHVHGLLGATLSSLAAGASVIVPPRFSASRFWATAQELGATWYSAVPTIHQVLLARSEDDAAPRGTFRFIRSCSSALAPATQAGLEERFEAPVLQAYGMTEAAHQMASNPLPPGSRKLGTVGPGTVDVAIMDDAGNLLPSGTTGEVVIRGPSVVVGYHNNPEANAASFTNGWFRTGDRGSLDADGYLTLAGRIKELINRGGEKISPMEIDAVLLAHPMIAEAVTYGAPDPHYGEVVHAAVVARSPLTADEVRRHCRDHLAEFKVPKVVHVVDQLPKSATGKLQRRLMPALLDGHRDTR